LEKFLHLQEKRKGVADKTVGENEKGQNKERQTPFQKLRGGGDTPAVCVAKKKEVLHIRGA